jgi:hypothetical protein
VPETRSSTSSYSATSFSFAAYSSSGGGGAGNNYGWPDDWDDSQSSSSSDYGWPDDWTPPGEEPEDLGGWASIGEDLCRKIEISGWFLQDIRDVHFDGGSRVQDGKGIWKANTSDSMLTKIFDLAEHKCTNWTQASQPRYRSCVFDPGLGTVGRKRHDGNEPTSLVELIVSIDGDAITMYPK